MEINSGGYAPTEATRDLAHQERLATFRVFMYHPTVYLMHAVAEEFEGIQDPARMSEHQRFRQVHFDDFPLEPGKVKPLACFYYDFHPEMKDCRIVAEAELSRMDFLLTYDKDLLKRLNGHTGHLALVTPSWFWEFMNIPKRTPPARELHPTHPQYSATWWPW